jgi:hypothetical protein
MKIDAFIREEVRDSEQADAAKTVALGGKAQ